MTISLPDELTELAKRHDLDVSTVCQDALRHELARRDKLTKLDSKMQRVVVDAKETHGGNVAFVGRQVYYSDVLPEVSAYVTAHRRIAVHDSD